MTQRFLDGNPVAAEALHMQGKEKKRKENKRKQKKTKEKKRKEKKRKEKKRKEQKQECPFLHGYGDAFLRLSSKNGRAPPRLRVFVLWCRLVLDTTARRGWAELLAAARRRNNKFTAKPSALPDAPP